MLDFGHIPDISHVRESVFVGNAKINGPATMVWQKPRGISMVRFLAVGQGGNGGFSTAAATSPIPKSGAGGHGGGSGGQTLLTIPAVLLPDVLYIQAGAGGAGTAVITYVASAPHGATYNSVPFAHYVLAANGAPGNSVTAGANMITGWLYRGNFRVWAGLAGRTATTSTGGPPAANNIGLLVSGGGAGGGTNQSFGTAGGAGATTAPRTPYTIARGGAGGTSGVNGGAGTPGITSLRDLMFTAGGGGGGGFPLATKSSGGGGGAGGWGCGGGTPGKGGPGFVIITCW